MIRWFRARGWWLGLVGLILTAVLMAPPPGETGDRFRRGYGAYREGRYETAGRVFRRLIRDSPGSPRSRDGRYFLRRIRTFGEGGVSPPVLRVRLAHKRRVAGRTRSRLRIRGPDGSIRGRMPSGTEWAAQTGAGSDVEISAEGLVRRGRPYLRLEPAGDEAGLVHGGTAYRGRFELRARQGNVTLINVIPVHHYLYGVVRKEIAPGWPRAVVKAQAVAARSFALDRVRRSDGRPFDLDAGSLAQVYGGRAAETRRVIRAVNATRGQVLVHRGRLVPGFFHANSGGHVETAGAIWTGSRTPYIVSKPDTWSLGARHDRWRETVSHVRLDRALREAGHPGIHEDPGVRVEERLPSGRTRTLSYRTDEGSRRRIEAETFRLAVGANRLRSAWFESIRGENDRIRFRGRGWGHGVGMSQWGAHAMAEAGVGYRRILSFYYQNGRLHPDYGPGLPGVRGDD